MDIKNGKLFLCLPWMDGMEDRVDLKFIRVNGSGEIEGLFKYDTIVKTRCIYGIETRIWVLKALRFATKVVQIFTFPIW